VAVVDTRVDPISRTILVRALLDNSDQRLRPGMFLTVELLRTDVVALMIPEQSIIPDQSRQHVLVIGSDGLVEKREVKTGRRRPGQVEILSGIGAGERVIAEGTQKARPGARVSIVREIEVAPARSDQDTVVIREGSDP
jgi:membrane fusion protein (multidrug efflux system)